MPLGSRQRCVDGITANPEKCRHYLEESPSVITALTPKIGYSADPNPYP